MQHHDVHPQRRHTTRASSRFNLRPLAFAVRISLPTLLLSGVAMQAHAQTAAQTISYDVPAGPLADALNRYAQQSGISIAIDADKVAGKQSAGIRGSYGVDEGFRVLLRDTGYEMRKTDAGYVLVAPTADNRSSGSLPAVSVTERWSVEKSGAIAWITAAPTGTAGSV